MPVPTHSPYHSLHLPLPPFIHSPKRARSTASRKAQGPPHHIQTEQGIHPKTASLFLSVLKGEDLRDDVRL